MEPTSKASPSFTVSTTSQGHQLYDDQGHVSEEQLLASPTTLQAIRFHESKKPEVATTLITAQQSHRFKDTNPLRWTPEILSLLLGASSLLSRLPSRHPIVPAQGSKLFSHCCRPMARKRNDPASETPGSDAQHLRRLLQLRSQGCLHVSCVPGTRPA